MDPTRPTSQPPGSVPLSRALQGSEPLAGLMGRIDESRRRLAAVQDLLAPALRSSVRAGPLDDEAWVLLADNAATAAKLRQQLPSIAARLLEAGWVGPEPKVKIQPRAPA